MRTVHELSALAHVSVRTLHHYDAIGLLKPTDLSPGGYRLYDDCAARRLDRILLYRQLGFSLADIALLLDASESEQQERLDRHIRSLERQREHLDAVITRARHLHQKGEKQMQFATDEHTLEAREKWGNTKPFQEYEQKTRTRSRAESNLAAARLMDIFSEMGALRSLTPDDPAVQSKVTELKSFLEANYYSVDDQILLGLGALYVEDERFRRNIDASGGEGTAQFTLDAIRQYVAAH